MVVPNQKEIGAPLLEFLKDKKVHHIEKIWVFLADHFELSEEERNLQKSSGNEGLFHNRIRWANFYLRKAGLIESARGTGKSKITESGIELAKEKQTIIDTDFLMRYPMFKEYRESVLKKKRS
jgi:restriction system protein